MSHSVIGGSPGDQSHLPPFSRAPDFHRKNYALEKRYGREFLAQLEVTDEVPPLDTVLRLFVLTWHKDRPVLVRWDGGEEPGELMIPAVGRDLTPHAAAPMRSDVDDGTFATAAISTGKKKPSAQLGAWLKTFAQDQWGMRIKDWYQHSRLAMTATDDATTVEPGSVHYELILCATASKLDDLADDAPWARRLSNTRDLNQLIKFAHREIDEVLEAAHDDYLVRQAQASAQASAPTGAKAKKKSGAKTGTKAGAKTGTKTGTKTGAKTGAKASKKAGTTARAKAGKA